jgi:N-glycosylase/DNA lyase
MVEVIKWKVRHNKKTYLPCEQIDDLSGEEESRLITQGFAKRIGSMEEKSQEDIETAISKLTVDDAKILVETIQDLEELNELLECELADKNRKTLVQFIEDRIAEVEGV